MYSIYVKAQFHGRAQTVVKMPLPIKVYTVFYILAAIFRVESL